MREIKIDKKNEGGRLDKLLFRLLGNASAGFVYKQLRKKNIVLNDKKAAGNEILKSGDIVQIFFSEAAFDKLCRDRKTITPAENGIHFSSLIVFEDENIIALNKPAGMLSQKSKPDDITLDDYLKEYLSGTSSYDGFVPGISNRLDRNTTGLVLAGKTLAASRALNAAIKERELAKKYLCIVKGIIAGPEHIEGYLVKDSRTNKVSVKEITDRIEPMEEHLIKEGTNKNESEKGSKGKLPAGDKIITEYCPLMNNGSRTLLEVSLITGKPHQIRAHLASAGHPLAGDYKYGDVEFNSYFKSRYNLASQFLHASSVEFSGMKGSLAYLNGKKIEAELPDKFKKILAGEGLWQHGKAGA